MASDVDDLRRAARAAFSRDDDARLAVACAQLIARVPEDVEARRLRGRAAMRALDPHAAEPWLRETAARASDDVTAWMELARAHAELGDLEHAEAALDAAVARGVCDAAVHTMMGMIRLARGRTDGARESFEAALDMDPAWAEAYRGLAACGGLDADDPYRARAEKLVAEDSPRCAAASYALADAALRDGAFDAALDRLTHANRAQARACSTRNDTGAALLRRAMRAAPAARAAFGRASAPALRPVFVLAARGVDAEPVEAALSSAMNAPRLDESPYFLAALRELERETGKPAPEGVDKLGAAVLERAATAYTQRVTALAPDAAVVIDRIACGARIGAALGAVFSNAVFVRVVQDPVDQGLAVYREPAPVALARTTRLPAIARQLKLEADAERALESALGERLVSVRAEDFAARPREELARVCSAIGVTPAAQAPTPPARLRARLHIPCTPLPHHAWRAFGPGINALVNGLGGLARAYPRETGVDAAA